MSPEAQREMCQMKHSAIWEALSDSDLFQLVVGLVLAAFAIGCMWMYLLWAGSITP